MNAEQICYLSAAELGRLYREKELSPVEVVDAHIERTEALEPKLNSFITVIGDRARDAAGAAEKELWQGIDRGPLHGVPLGLKDAYDTRGLRTTYGCQVYDEQVPDDDSTTAVRLRAAGAVLIGKLNLHTLEFGPTGRNEFYGDMHNPWDVDRYAGGSSGGSGSSVAAGQVTVAMGSDSGGSVRIPASLCGIVGLKTTYGLLSRHGLMGLSPTMDHHGPMTRTVEDNAIMLNAIAGHDPKDTWSARRAVPDYSAALTGDVKGLRVGVVTEQFGAPMDPEVKELVQKAIEFFEDLGATVVDVSWPMFNYSAAISTAILLADTANALGGLVRKHGPKIEDLVRSRVESGVFVPVASYLKAQHARSLHNRQCYDLLDQQVDLLVGPTVPLAAPPIGDDEVQVGDATLPTVLALLQYTRAHNLTGLPAISVPCGLTGSDLPVGLQIVGRAYDEETVYRAAHAYEQATTWHERRPPV